MNADTQPRTCECGCGKPVGYDGVHCRYYRFVRGHGNRKPASCVLAITDPFELGWAVGIVEGEGCIGAYGNPKCPKVMVSSSDLGVVRRIKQTFGCGAIYTNNGVGNGLTKKQMYQWTTTRMADGIAVAEILYPYLSARRRAQVRRAFKLANLNVKS